MNEGESIETQTQPDNGEVESGLLNDLQTELEQAGIEKQGLLDELLRTRADMQNFRRRTEQERILFRQLATEDLVIQLLPILDNFERSLRAAEAGGSLESILEGIRMVDRQLRTVLDLQKVAKIPTIGEPFDPIRHEALMAGPSAEHEEGTVLQELEAGYQMSDKVIRVAKVRVAKNS